MRRSSFAVLGASLALASACSDPAYEDRTTGFGASGPTGASSTTGASSASGAGGSGGAPVVAPADGVMLQGFYWDVPQETPSGTWWENLAAKADDLAGAGVSAVWIPPPSKGHVGDNDVGYGLYDRYDLGEFDQKGGVATRYGTREQLLATIAALHARGIRVYADVVLNHMMGADEDETVTDLDGDAISVPTRFTFPGRAGVHSAFTWSADNFNGCQADGKWKQWHAWDFESGDNLLGCEIRYADEATRDETIAWGKWLTDELDLDGYRLDAVKHILLSFVNEWLDEVAVPGERFVVSEVWSGDRDDLEAYAEATEGRTTFFDVPLHYALAAMSDGEGAYDMRDLRFAGFSEIHGSAAVTFVDNHDTVHEGGSLYSPVGPAWKGLAYAYVLTRSHGQPCLFYPDLYEPDDPTLSDDLRRLVAIRLEHAHGKGWEHDETDHDVYVYSRRGDDAHAGLLLLMNDGDDEATREVASFFPSAALVDATGHVAGEVVTDAEGKGDFAVPGRGYSIWVPALP